MSREMKNSGIEWIGDIPKEWRTISFSNGISRMATGLNPRDNFELSKDDDLFYVTIRNFKDGKLYLDEECDKINLKAWEIIQERSQLHSGDILFASISKDGQAYILDDEAKNWNINESVFCIRVNPNYFQNKFFYYHIIENEFYKDLRLDATGTTFQSIKQNKLRKSILCLPPLSEQQKIADYLDKACGDIDDMIALQEKMIEELKAYKQSVITEAVTKGLNPNVPMRDSGIDWIGEIPEHWGLCKIKHCLSDDKNNLRVGPFGSALTGNDFISEGYWVYNQRCVLDSNFTLNDTFIDEKKYNELKSFEVFPDDILITTRGSIGKIAIVPENAPKGILHPCIIRFVINKSIIDYYLLKHIFNESDFILRQIRYQSNSTTIDVLYSYTLKNLVLTLPPITEQHAITSYLDKKCFEIDSLISIKQKKIEELKDYKKSVIYEYVTGKKQVN